MLMKTNDEPPADAAAGFAADQLRSVIERVERLREERKTIDDDIKDIFAEARSNGFHVPAIKELIKERATDADDKKRAKRDETDTLLDLYRRALSGA